MKPLEQRLQEAYKDNLEKENLFNKYATREQKLGKQLRVLSKGNINDAMLDTCEIYGLSGLCGKQCPKYQDKTCECIDEFIEKIEE